MQDQFTRQRLERMMVTRRHVLAGIVGSAAALASAKMVFGQNTNRFRIAGSRQPLRRLPVVDTFESGQIDLTATAGRTEFFPGAASTTLGFGQSYLGPVIRMRRGNAVDATVRNGLREHITLHWHGLMVPAEVDGGPHLLIAPGSTWSPKLAVDQPGATLWYHSHVHEKTAEQLHAGLAGVLLIDDGVDAEIGLPTTYGVDDLVLILQDKRFDDDGMSTYRPAMPDLMQGFRGETILVNGTVDPIFSVPKGIVRLRLVNAANARIFDLSFDDGRSFNIVATDLGLLARPVELGRLSLAPGERAEVLVDFGDGRPVDLVSAPDANAGRGMMGMGMMGGGSDPLDQTFPVIGFSVDPGISAYAVSIPTILANENPPLREPVRSREFTLDDAMGPGMMMRGGPSHSINGRPFDMRRLDFAVPLGTTESWTVRANGMAHPFHVHGARMRVLSDGGGPAKPENAGWKDTVLVDGSAELMVEFDQPAGRSKPFMMHCHILEHEDTGMMAQFAVET